MASHLRVLVVFYFFMLFPIFSFCLQASEGEETDRYLKGRLAESDKRYLSFKMALRLMQERRAKILLETGSARYGEKEFAGDGGSTIIFGDWAAHNRAILYSVDHSPEAIEAAKNSSKPFAKGIRLQCSDSLPYLEQFNKPIDFLYLDSEEYNIHDPLPSQEHHLREIVTVYPALHADSIVMFDDCDLPGGGQGKLAIEFLVDNNWKILHQGYQFILSQRE